MIAKNKKGFSTANRLRVRPLFFFLFAVCITTVVFFYTPVLTTVAMLMEIDAGAIQHPKQPLANFFRPQAGEDALPGTVQQMLSLLRAHSVPDYRLSKQIEQDELIRQRIIEAAWPVKMEPASVYRLSLRRNDPGDLACKVIDRTKDIALEYCR